MPARARSVVLMLVAGSIAATFAIQVSPLRVGVPRAMASCAPQPPEVVPGADAWMPRNGVIRVDAHAWRGPISITREGSAISVVETPLRGSSAIAPTGGWKKGRYTVSVGDEHAWTFTAGRDADISPPTWDGNVAWEIGHPHAPCTGDVLPDFFARASVHARDDVAHGDAIAWDVWTAIPPAVVDTTFQPTRILTHNGFIYLGPRMCDESVLELPLSGKVTIALRPVDLAGNVGPIYSSTILLEDAAPEAATKASVPATVNTTSKFTAPITAARESRLWRFLRNALYVRIALGVIAAAIVVSLIRLRSRRASSS